MDGLQRSLRRFKQNILRVCNNQWNLTTFTPPPWSTNPFLNLPPLTKDSVLFYYLPVHGVVTYYCLAVNVTNPNLVTRLLPDRDIINYLLISTITGSFLWLWKRPHLSGTGEGIRFSWAFLGSSMYSLGSVLLWAILRSSLGRRPKLSMFLGLLTGAVLTHSAIDYFHFLDRDIDIVENVSEISSEEQRYNID